MERNFASVRAEIKETKEDMERNFASVRAEIKETKEDIKELRVDVNELKEKVDLLGAKVDTHTLQLSSLENSVRTLNFRANSFLTRFNSIETDLQPLKQSNT